MSNQYLGEIAMFAGNFAPRQYAMCNGQLLSIAQNSALFALIGTYYGGNGMNNFALPDLRSRVPVHVGTGPGLSNYALGQTGGAPTVALNPTMMPAHNHMLQASTDAATATTIDSTVVPGQPTAGNTPSFYAVQKPNEPLTTYVLNPQTCGPSGGNQPHQNMMPSLCITFIIALQGVFPSRN